MKTHLPMLKCFSKKKKTHVAENLWNRLRQKFAPSFQSQLASQYFSFCHNITFKIMKHFSFPERAIDLDLLSFFLKLPICFIYCFYLFLFWKFTCDSLKYFFFWISEGNGITYACILHQSRSYYVYFVATLNPKLMC